MSIFNAGIVPVKIADNPDEAGVVPVLYVLEAELGVVPVQTVLDEVAGVVPVRVEAEAGTGIVPVLETEV